MISSPIIVENGNLLSNGAGQCLTTRKVLDENRPSSRGEEYVSELLREYLGARQVVYLEPLAGEPNEHVDMFATFTAPDTIVVGSYTTSDDPQNSATLDRNAERLAQVKTAFGPLKVHRVPMPQRVADCWYTYTNVVCANGTLLVPTYGEFHRETASEAMTLYRELLPGWKIVGVDASSIIPLNGAPHCATMNIHTLPYHSTLSRASSP